jgi:hypothetical protein
MNCYWKTWKFADNVACLLLLLLLLLYDMDISCHRPFLPGTYLEPAVIPTAQASSFTLQYFPYYVWCSKYIIIIINFIDTSIEQPCIAFKLLNHSEISKI